MKTKHTPKLTYAIDEESGEQWIIDFEHNLHTDKWGVNPIALANNENEAISLIKESQSHTGKKWVLCGNSLVIDEQSGEHIVDVNHLSDSIKRFANAKLIAAAPDLLEALEFIVNCMPEPGENAVLTIDGYNKACEAIKLATS